METNKINTNKPITEFSKSVIDEIEYYVYVLLDPRDGKIFYVGKGVGSRVFQHAEDALMTSTPTDKLEIIRDIIKSHQMVRYYIIRHHLSEDTAFEVESTLIDFLSYGDFKDIAKISNIQSGHHQWDHGIKTVEEIQLIYDSKNCDFLKIPYNFIAININKTYDKKDTTDDNVYQGVRFSWKISKKHADKRFILAVYHGIIRGIYETDENGWQKVSLEQARSQQEIDRYFFNKSVIDSDELNKVRDSLLNTKLSYKFNQNPIIYIDKVK